MPTTVRITLNTTARILVLQQLALLLAKSINIHSYRITQLAPNFPMWMKNSALNDGILKAIISFRNA